MAKQAKTTDKNPFKIVLGTHRVTYVHVKEPTAFEDGADEKYDATFLIPYGHPDVEKINEVVKALYLANKESLFKGLPMTSPKFWNPLRDGEDWIADGHPEATEYEGHYFIKASSKSRPACFDSDKQEIIDLDEVYSGSYCRGVIAGFAFNNKSKGVGFFLNSLMKMEEGERLGGFAANVDDYDEPEETTAPAKKGPNLAKPAPAAKSNRIFDFDADGAEIYSDNGEDWFFVGT